MKSEAAAAAQQAEEPPQAPLKEEQADSVSTGAPQAAGSEAKPTAELQVA